MFTPPFTWSNRQIHVHVPEGGRYVSKRSCRSTPARESDTSHFTGMRTSMANMTIEAPSAQITPKNPHGNLNVQAVPTNVNSITISHRPRVHRNRESCEGVLRRP